MCYRDCTGSEKDPRALFCDYDERYLTTYKFSVAIISMKDNLPGNYDSTCKI
jgi:hypothetical protein